MESTEYSSTDTLLNSSAYNFSFGQASGSVDAQDDATAASKFDPTYVAPRHHLAYQHVFPPHNTWERPVELPGETACNANPFEDIDWYDAGIQALVKEALHMNPPTPSGDVTPYCKFVSLPPAANRPKVSYMFTATSITCPPAPAVLIPPPNQSLSPEPHFSWPLSPQVVTSSSNLSPSSLPPLPHELQHPSSSSTTCATNVTSSHGTTDAHDADPSSHRPLITPNAAGIPDEADNSSWHSRNPGRPTLHIRHSEPLTDAQKATRRITNEEWKRKEATLSDTVKKLAEELSEKIGDIMQEHSVAVKKVSKLLTGHINYKKSRKVSFSNALIRAKVLEVNTGKSYIGHTYLPGELTINTYW